MANQHLPVQFFSPFSLGTCTKPCGGAASDVGHGAGGGGPSTVRALRQSRGIDGGASPRPSNSRRKTPRASGDGPASPHGEKVVGDVRSQRHRKPPERSE